MLVVCKELVTRMVFSAISLSLVTPLEHAVAGTTVDKGCIRSQLLLFSFENPRGFKTYYCVEAPDATGLVRRNMWA